MRKFIKSLTIIILIQLLFTGCCKTDYGEAPIQNGTVITPAASDNETPDENLQKEFEAEVIEAKETLLVTPQEGSDELRSSDKITVDLTDAALINEEGDTISLEDLKAGDIIEITYNGVIMESYPAQISADKVERSGQNLLLDGYLELIDHIYQQDDGLNSDITMIALDTTEWAGLTEIEKEIVFEQVKDRYQFEVINATYDQLVDQGLVDSENLFFNQGILISIRNIKYNEKKKKITCSLEKWRSGLGAIGSDEVTAKYGQGEWTITEKGMWIS